MARRLGKSKLPALGNLKKVPLIGKSRKAGIPPPGTNVRSTPSGPQSVIPHRATDPQQITPKKNILAEQFSNILKAPQSRAGQAQEPEGKGFFARAKEEGFTETLRRGRDVGREEVLHETPSNLDLALAAGGATGASEFISKGLGAGAEAIGLAKFSTAARRMLTIKETNRLRAINRLSTRSGNSVKMLSDLVHNAQLNKEVIDIVKGTSVLKFAAGLGKLGLKATGTVLGANVLVTWYALDNIITGQKFFLKEILKGLRDGSITPEAGAEALTESEQSVSIADEFATASAEKNPIFFPAKKTLLAGLKGDKAANDLTILQIEQELNATAQPQQEFSPPETAQEAQQQDFFNRRAES